MFVQHAPQLRGHPGGVEVDGVNLLPGGGVKPLIARPPVVLVEVGPRRPAQTLDDALAVAHGYLGAGVDIEVDVGRGVGRAAGQRPTQGDGHDLR